MLHTKYSFRLDILSSEHYHITHIMFTNINWICLYIHLFIHPI